MRRLELKIYNGQFRHRGVLRRLRRKLEQSAAMGECIVVDGEHVEGLSAVEVSALFSGLPWTKIKPLGFPALRPWPLPLPGTLSQDGSKSGREGPAFDP
jgi:hypothetical protein